jgi:protein gp37
MGEHTGISWTEKTWNPWHGCTKISPGCKFCYMYTEKERYGQDPMICVRSKTTFNDPLKWKEPAMVFTCSWSDWFIDTADQWRGEAWAIMRQTPHLTYQILTKRPERMLENLPSDWGKGYENVWLGVSAENQEYADLRIPQLLKIPARIHFVSYEPALGILDLKWKWVSKGKPLGGGPRCNLLRPWEEPQPTPGIDWVICGGESGPERREFQKTWAEHIRDQCEMAGVKFYMKQMSAITSAAGAKLIPPELLIQEFPAS